MDLEKNFAKLCKHYTNDEKRIKELWQEIYLSFNSTKRYYHTFEHLKDLYSHLDGFLESSYEFAIFYHDSIYDVLRDDNEERSALLAKKHLESLKVPSDTINEVETFILESKTHTPSNQKSALFLDADIAILGSKREKYITYVQNIQKEYSHLSKDAFIKGRKKVIRHFLEKNRIYNTSYFFQKFENQARANLVFELEELDNFEPLASFLI